MKRSGFHVTLTLFFRADAKDRDQMTDAMDRISDMLTNVAENADVLDVKQRFMLSKDIPDDPAALAQEQVEERAAQGQAGMGEPVRVPGLLANSSAGPTLSGKLIEQPPPIPAAQRRA